ncbi:MAG TPA: hypothetical protein VLA39_13255 [Marinobacterium sp.]|nr:hypothetical protein [Marinobacterium sp.]
MSEKLAKLLENVRREYLHEMDANGHSYPFLTAHRVANKVLALSGQELAELVAEDPKLLAARASELIEDPKEVANPSVGAIISANLVVAGIEGLIVVAVNRNWMGVDDEGAAQIEAHEMDLIRPYAGADYSATSGEFTAHRGRSKLSQLFGVAEAAFEEQLENGTHDAYQLALSVAADHAIFAPDDLAPFILENPLLLGLRDDGMVDPELFEGDPPAGMIISAHLTEMLVQQLVERAVSMGALGCDAAGHPLIDDSEEDNPTVH